jgi:CHASE3 domain sensor protein
MNTFKYIPERFAEFRNTQFIRSVPIMVIAMSVGAYITSANNPNAVSILPFIVPFFIAILSFSLYRSSKRLRVLYNSYSLNIHEQFISSKQANIPDITIAASDVKELQLKSNGDILVQGRDKYQKILISRQIENYDEVLAQLQKLTLTKPFAKSGKIEYFRIPAVLFLMVLMIVSYTSANKILATISAFITVVSLLYSVIELQRSKNIDQKIKKMSWIILLPVLSLIFLILLRWIR